MFRTVYGPQGRKINLDGIPLLERERLCLRVMISAAHEKEDLDEIIEVFGRIGNS